MAPTSKPIVNFSGGEASPKLWGRSDVVPFFTCGEKLENVLVSNYGSAYRTPGTRFIARAKPLSYDIRLLPFIYSVGQSYVLEFGNYYMRVFQNSGSVVEDPIVISNISNGYPAILTTDQPHGYSNGDYFDIEGVVGMTEVNNKRFEVYGHTDYTITLKNEDLNLVNSTNYTPYSYSGTIERVYQIVTPWSFDQVKDLKFTQQADVMYIVHPNHPPKKLSRYGNLDWRLEDFSFDTFNYPPFLPINVTATTVTPSATTGTITLTSSTDFFTADFVDTYFQITHGTTTGYVLITGFTDTKHVIATVIVTLGGTSATDDWYESSWSIYNGYPRDVKFFENRLYFFGTYKYPLTVWGSVIEEYENFKYGTNDDDAISYRLSSAQVDRILWAYPTQIINIGTAAGIFSFQSGSTIDPVSITNVSVKLQNEDGADVLSPIRIGSYVYYIERSKNILGQLTYDLNTDSYVTDNITYLNDHVLGTSIVDMAFQAFPNKILWCVRSDGQIATLTREQSNNVKAWTRQKYSDPVKRVCVIPNGVEDQTWLVFSRRIDGHDKLYIEVVMPTTFDAQDDAWFVESGMELISNNSGYGDGGH
jgi:hypothetical protein